MAEIVKELTLEVYSANRIKAIVAKQYDYKSRYLLIRLTDGGEDINVEASSVVTVNAFRPNGESAAFLGSAEQDGRILVPLTYWMLELEGTVKCDVSVVDTEERKLSSTNFQIEVERANYSGDDIEQDEHYDLLVDLLAEVAQAQEAENARVAAETARVTAENNRVSAETARQTAETARASAETARATAEGTRSSAETTRQSNETSRVTAEAERVLAETARAEAEEAREQALLDYAKKDGFYEGLTAGLAENLTPYSEDSGITQTQPFFLEGNGCGNGESVADVGTYLQLKEKRGNMVTVNQRSKSFDEVGYTAGQWTFPTVDWATVNRTADSITYTVTSVPSEQFVSIATCWGSPAVGHTYLALCDISSNSTGSWFARTFVCNVPQWTNSKCYVVTTSSSSSNYFQFTLQSSGLSIGDIITIKNPKLVDLTQWFNGNIPAYLLSRPEAFGRYYKGSLAYEPGRLEPATGRYFESEGRNIWDEEWESGYFDRSSGNKLDSNVYFRSKNFISVTPGQAYYFYHQGHSTFNVLCYDRNKQLINGYFGNVSITSATIPTDCFYITFFADGTTYNNDITISRYYEGESGYDQYYPHKVLANIDTGTELLYSAGSAYDSKVPSGLITRRIGSVDLGTRNWVSYSNYGYIFLTNPKRGSTNIIAQMPSTIISYVINDNNDGFVVTYADGTFASADELKTAMSGVMLYFELAAPTTEQGTPFQDNVPIDDFGQLSWSDTDVPQGNQIFYPVDYKAAIDTLINYTGGNMTSIALKDDITDAALNARGYYKMEDLSSGITDVAGLTYETKKLYKCGNVLTLFVKATNNTGSDIANGSVLFTLPSGIYLSFQYSIPYLQEYTPKCAIMSTNRILNIDGVIPNNKPIFISFTYALA